MFKENYEAAGRRSLSGVEGRKTCFISGEYEMEVIQPGGWFMFKENYEASGRRSLSGVEGRKTCSFQANTKCVMGLSQHWATPNAN